MEPGQVRELFDYDPETGLRGVHEVGGGLAMLLAHLTVNTGICASALRVRSTLIIV